MLKYQEIDIHNVYQSYFHFFTTNQTLNCLEFVNWCANNYSLSKRVIMDISKSKILCPVTSFFVNKNMLVPDEFTLKAKDYDEESIV